MGARYKGILHHYSVTVRGVVVPRVFGRIVVAALFGYERGRKIRQVRHSTNVFRPLDFPSRQLVSRPL